MTSDASVQLAREYVEAQQIEGVTTDALARCVAEKPADALAFMADQLLAEAERRNSDNTQRADSLHVARSWVGLGLESSNVVAEAEATRVAAEQASDRARDSGQETLSHATAAAAAAAAAAAGAAAMADAASRACAQQAAATATDPTASGSREAFARATAAAKAIEKASTMVARANALGSSEAGARANEGEKPVRRLTNSEEFTRLGATMLLHHADREREREEASNGEA